MVQEHNKRIRFAGPDGNDNGGRDDHFVVRFDDSATKYAYVPTLGESAFDSADNAAPHAKSINEFLGEYGDKLGLEIKRGKLRERGEYVNRFEPETSQGLQRLLIAARVHDGVRDAAGLAKPIEQGDLSRIGKFLDDSGVMSGSDMGNDDPDRIVSELGAALQDGTLGHFYKPSAFSVQEKVKGKDGPPVQVEAEAQGVAPPALARPPASPEPYVPTLTMSDFPVAKAKKDETGEQLRDGKWGGDVLSDDKHPLYDTPPVLVLQDVMIRHQSANREQILGEDGRFADSINIPTGVELAKDAQRYWAFKGDDSPTGRDAYKFTNAMLQDPDFRKSLMEGPRHLSDAEAGAYIASIQAMQEDMRVRGAVDSNISVWAQSYDTLHPQIAARLGEDSSFNQELADLRADAFVRQQASPPAVAAPAVVNGGGDGDADAADARRSVDVEGAASTGTGSRYGALEVEDSLPSQYTSSEAARDHALGIQGFMITYGPQLLQHDDGTPYTRAEIANIMRGDHNQDDGKLSEEGAELVAEMMSAVNGGKTDRDSIALTSENLGRLRDFARDRGVPLVSVKGFALDVVALQRTDGDKGGKVWDQVYTEQLGLVRSGKPGNALPGGAPSIEDEIAAGVRADSDVRGTAYRQGGFGLVVPVAPVLATTNQDLFRKEYTALAGGEGRKKIFAPESDAEVKARRDARDDVAKERRQEEPAEHSAKKAAIDLIRVNGRDATVPEGGGLRGRFLENADGTTTVPVGQPGVAAPSVYATVDGARRDAGVPAAP